MARRHTGPVFTSLEKTSIYSLSSILFFRMFSLFLVLPVFSVLARENFTEATPALIGLAFGAYGLTQALFQIPFGVWSDRIGRKPMIAAGLGIFLLGSLLAAVSTNIYLMIAARFLQGVGAISAPIFALIADLTRPEVRARANAGLGGGIGLAFGLAFASAPFLAHWLGLQGFFLLIAALTLISGALLLLWVPNPPRPEPTQASVQEMMRTVWRIPSLRVINFGAFLCNMGLSATFVVAPLLMQDSGVQKSELWKVYLPMLLLGGIAMVAAAIVAEVKNRFRQVMLVGAAMLVISFLLSGWGKESHQLWIFLGGMFLFFMGFNVFEPLFPSLVTRLTTAETKGTASGMNNFAQFMGNFVGAALGGAFYQHHAYLLTFLLMGCGAVFFYLVLSFPNPTPRVSPPEPAGG